jgi:hypothetical protein
LAAARLAGNNVGSHVAIRIILILLAVASVGAFWIDYLIIFWEEYK